MAEELQLPHPTPEQLGPITQESHPRAFEAANSTPDDWVVKFNEETYGSLILDERAVLVRWIENLAIGLGQRGATDLALKVRAGGMLTQQLLWEVESEGIDLVRLCLIQNYLSFLDDEIGEGLKNERSATGMSARVLCLSLQMLVNDFLEKEAAKIRLH